MNITVIGAGYVGLVTGACFAELGNHVTCVDINIEKIANLKAGIMPIYEPGLEPMVLSNMQTGRLQFETQMTEDVEPAVIFIAVGTPSNKDGAADIRYVLEAARTIGKRIKEYCVIVDKSTVPVGMADQVNDVIQEEINKRNLQVNFDVVSNPEFLREGAAITDFMQPDRVIIGIPTNNQAKNVMLDLYTPIMRNPERIYFMRVKDAEMTKYAANAMLATRISFMNEMSVLCEALDVDIENVRIGIGSDSRIGQAFLNAGCGYGGSCFPKDVRALMRMAEKHAVEPYILQAVEKRNAEQKNILAARLVDRFGPDLSGIKIALWGLSFKPGTDDIREAPSRVLIEGIIEAGGRVLAYDPVAMQAAREYFPAIWFSDQSVILVEHQYEALQQVDALVLVTEWKPFCYPDLAAMQKLMRQKVILDGRNQYDPKAIRAAGFEYYGMGRGKISVLHDSSIRLMEKVV